LKATNRLIAVYWLKSNVKSIGNQTFNHAKTVHKCVNIRTKT